MTHRAQLRLAQKILTCIESSRSPPVDPPTLEAARRMIDLADYLPLLLSQIDHGRL